MPNRIWCEGIAHYAMGLQPSVRQAMLWMIADRRGMAMDDRVTSPRTVNGEPTSLPTDLFQAYRAAIYEFEFLMQSEELRIGDYCPALEAIFNITGGLSSAFITAANPRGVALTEHENEHRHNMLLDDIATRSFRALPSHGRDAEGEWPAEKSLLIIGLSRETAIAIGQTYEQNAIIWNDETFVPALLLLR